MDGNLIASHWIITSLENQIRIERGAETTKWGNRMILEGEGLGSLALVNEIVNKTRNLNQGEVTECFDNEHVLKNIENDVKKESQSTVEAVATLEGIRQVTKQEQVTIKFEHAKPNPK